MATVLSTLYPPLVETFMPAFPYEGPAPITFSISAYNETNSFHKIHISLTKQATNNSVLKNGEYSIGNEQIVIFNGIWILNKNSRYITTKDQIIYTINIPTEILNTDNKKFVIDDYYKVQIRLDESTDTPTDSTYLSVNRPKFSEWSSVCLIKAIPKVSLVMKDFETKDVIGESNGVGQTLIRVIQKGIVPIVGRLEYSDSSEDNINSPSNESISAEDKKYYMTEENEQNTTIYDETLQKYKITITSKKTNEIIDETKWVLTATSQDPNRIYWLADLTNAEAEEEYAITIQYYTKNQYYSSEEYTLQIASYDATPFKPVFTFKSAVLDDNSQSSGQKVKIATEEDGYVTLTITSNAMPSGYIYVKRATSLDNFKKWELISCTKNSGQINRTIIDKTVGSLVRYRYSVQYMIKKNGQWTETKFSKTYDLKSSFYDVYPDFHDILLLRGDKQLAIRYNDQITSYNQVINRQVINTLGSKYPKFAENAQMNYKKITISGLLTAESDFNRTFLNERNFAADMNAYDKEMDGVYEVRNDTLADGDKTYLSISTLTSPDTYNITHNLAETTDHDLYPKNNWWWERKFRDTALEWLNDGEPKLFRSMTEGNMAVMLTDITLSPNAQLGRRIYNVSMTAYEIGDGYSLETLSSLGIIDIPNEYEDAINAIGMGINDSDADDGENDTISIQTVGQMYERSGKTLENSQTLSTVTDEGGISWESGNTEVFTIDDFYKYTLYQGGLKNYTPVDDSYELTDVRIQFSSKPQWFNLIGKSITPIYVIGKQEDTVEVKDRTLIGGYSTHTGTDTIKDKENKDKEKEVNYGLGYKLGIITTQSEDEIDIFVGEKGYYQVPSNIVVKEIILYHGAKATIDYKLKYKIIYNEISIPKESSISKPLIGQINGRWYPGTDIVPIIEKKYEYMKKATDKDGKIDLNRGYEGVAEIHYLDNLSAFGFDGTTYSVLRIKFKGENEGYNRYVVGRTGVYNLMTDYPIDEIRIVGRRLFRKVNPDYTHNNHTKTYTMHSSTYMYQGVTEDALRWTNFNTNDSEEQVLMIYNDALDLNSQIVTINNDMVRTLDSAHNGIAMVIGDLEDTSSLPFESESEIENPASDTIYGFYNEESEIILKLYDGIEWKEIELGYNELNDSHILIVKGNNDPIKTNRKKFGLYDWEYDLDSSADPNYKEAMQTWYDIFTGKTTVQVIFKDGKVPSNHIFRLDEEEYIPAIDGYKSEKDIINPQYNTVYKIKNKDGEKYRIYYIDGCWYDAEKYASSDKDLTETILAKVPIDAMLNYRGRKISLIYDDDVIVTDG